MNLLDDGVEAADLLVDVRYFEFPSRLISLHSHPALAT
jgi:hypothetical protein